MEYIQTQISADEISRLLDGDEIELRGVDAKGNEHLVYVEPV